MSTERNIKRYSTYYQGWCLAFGEHKLDYEEESGIHWVFGKSQVGFVIGDELKRRMFRELLGHHGQIPEVQLSLENMRLNQFEYQFSERERTGVDKIQAFITAHEQLHMFLTSHFCYPPRTRIVTLSPKKPPVILYKEITPMQLTLA